MPKKLYFKNIKNFVTALPRNPWTQSILFHCEMCWWFVEWSDNQTTHNSFSSFSVINLGHISDRFKSACGGGVHGGGRARGGDGGRGGGDSSHSSTSHANRTSAAFLRPLQCGVTTPAVSECNWRRMCRQSRSCWLFPKRIDGRNVTGIRYAHWPCISPLPSSQSDTVWLPSFYSYRNGWLCSRPIITM